MKYDMHIAFGQKVVAKFQRSKRLEIPMEKMLSKLNRYLFMKNLNGFIAMIHQGHSQGRYGIGAVFYIGQLEKIYLMNNLKDIVMNGQPTDIESLLYLILQ